MCWNNLRNTVSIPNPAKGVPQRSQATKRIYYKAATAWFPEHKSLSFQTKMCLLPKTLDSKLISVELETNSIYYFECSCFFRVFVKPFCFTTSKKKQKPCPQNRGSSSCKPVQRHGLPHQKSKLISLCLRKSQELSLLVWKLAGVKLPGKKLGLYITSYLDLDGSFTIRYVILLLLFGWMGTPLELNLRWQFLVRVLRYCNCTFKQNHNKKHGGWWRFNKNYPEH